MAAGAETGLEKQTKNVMAAGVPDGLTLLGGSATIRSGIASGKG